MISELLRSTRRCRKRDRSALKVAKSIGRMYFDVLDPVMGDGAYGRLSGRDRRALPRQLLLARLLLPGGPRIHRERKHQQLGAIGTLDRLGPNTLGDVVAAERVQHLAIVAGTATQYAAHFRCRQHLTRERRARRKTP